MKISSAWISKIFYAVLIFLFLVIADVIVKIIRVFSLIVITVLFGLNFGVKPTLADDEPPQVSETPTAAPTQTATEAAPPDGADEFAPTETITPATTDAPVAPLQAEEDDDERHDEPQQEPPPGDYLKGEALVKLRKAALPEDISECMDGMEFSAKWIEDLEILKVRVEPGYEGDALARLRNCAAVKYAEPNYAVYAADLLPNDPLLGNQAAALNAIRAPQGWGLATGSAAVTIAIVDTGVDLTHPDLADKLVNGWDFYNNDPVAQDDSLISHGTHVAGVAAAASNNGAGVAGVSWGAQIMPVKVLSPTNSGFSATVALGIKWAADHGAQVINLSLGTTSPSLVLQDAVNYAYSMGCVLVAATGNDASGVIRYPAQYPRVIAVGAVDAAAYARAGFSNYGAGIDLTAPGVSIYSTTIGGYDYRNGTSMAAAYVSGLAAILRGYPGGYAPDAIEWIMESTAQDLGAAGWDGEHGYGLIQMDAAIRQVLPPTPTATALNGDDSARTRPQALPPAGLAPFATWTLTPTPTVMPVSATPTASAEAPLAANPSPTSTPQPEGLSAPEALQPAEEKATSAEESPNSFGLPLAGMLAILLGAWLFVVAGKQRRRGKDGRA